MMVLSFDGFPGGSDGKESTCNVRAAAAKSLQSCPTLCDPMDGSPWGSHPWDSPGKNTGVGCHFLLQCRKVKSESEVTQQSYPTLPDPMDYSLPGSSVHGIFQARVLEWGTIAFSGELTQTGVKSSLPCSHGCIFSGANEFEHGNLRNRLSFWKLHPFCFFSLSSKP